MENNYSLSDEDVGLLLARLMRVERWYQHGNRHRDGGPAIIWLNGTQRWFQNNKRHRADGPAVIRFRGPDVWFLDGNQIPTPPFLKIIWLKVRKMFAKWRRA